MRSALKVNGRRLYQLARAGMTVERQARPVEIHQIKLLRRTGDKLLLAVDCSKGTYIRTLAEDLAERLGTCATMTFLVRTRAGAFCLSDASTLEELKDRPQAQLLPPDAVLGHLNKLQLSPEQSARFSQGVKTAMPNTPAGQVRVYSSDGLLVGIGETDGQTLKPRKVLTGLYKL